jgi:YD repeat-containing protein
VHSNRPRASPLGTNSVREGVSLELVDIRLAYDARGNLKTVNQGTQPQRTFSYDLLSRLTQAINPARTGSVGRGQA